jgi:hypothetical protein
MNNRRQYYRIQYPAFERPRLVSGWSITEVLECSERGIRFRTAGGPPDEGTRVSGRVGLRHGQEVRIAGVVVWSDADEVALHLDDEPIPFLCILREHLYLRRVAGW